MELLQVVGDLVCTRRAPGLYSVSLRVLRNARGRLSVAVDPVGAPPGKWVFATTGTAARYAAGDYTVLTDLTICGIVDRWDRRPSGSTESEARAAVTP